MQVFLVVLWLVAAADAAEIASPHGLEEQATTGSDRVKRQAATIRATGRSSETRRLQRCRSAGKMCSTSDACCDGLICKNSIGGRRELQGMMMMKKKACVAAPPNKCLAENAKCGSQLSGRRSRLPCCDGFLCNEGNASPARCVAVSNPPPGRITLEKQPLQPFSQSILSGYTSLQEFETDLLNAALDVIEQVCNGHDEDGMGRWAVGGGPEDINTVTGGPPEGGAGGGSTPPEVGNVDDFGTNNQEDGIEEGDVIVSDGTFVYAAYGDHLAIWDPRNGTHLVDTLQMPPVEVNGTDFRRRQLRYSNRRRRRQQEATSGIWGGGWWGYNPKPAIRHLVMHQGRLLVVVEGYEHVMRERQGFNATDPTAVFGFLSTHLRLYETSATGHVTLIKSTHVHGNFNELRVIGGQAHVMTVSNINTWQFLVLPFQRWYFDHNILTSGGKPGSSSFWGGPHYEYDNSTDANYTAYCEAEGPVAAQQFVQKVVEELTVEGTVDLPNLIRINTWQEHQAENLTIEDIMDQRFEVLNSLALIHSFDMQEAAGASTDIAVTSSGSFLPGYWALFYGNANTLITACQSWNFLPGSWRTISTTYLIGFGITDDGTTIPESIGHVDGYLLNSYSIDAVDNVLRVGTSINRWWTLWQDDETTDAEEESRTENFIILLDMKPDPAATTGSTSMMEEIARLDLGEPNELFTAIRFFTTVAYAVTFERRDPFYVIDFTDPRQPNVTAALKISGFSSYLHSMNDDNTMLLAIGQEADELTGMPLGVQMSVFDVTTPTNPQLVQRHVVEQDTFSYSFTDMEHDFQSGRYNRESQRLIIPMNVWAARPRKSFHGFLTFYVSNETILEECRIEHGKEDENTDIIAPCWYCAYFPPRSMIFDGNLMTVKDHFIQSTDMNTCEERYSLQVVIEENEGDCCGLWWFG